MTESTHPSWKPIYKLGGIAALLAVFVFRRNLGAELFASQGFGLFRVPASMPAGAPEWFALLQSAPLVGLTLLEMFDLVEYALVGLIFLAACAALWRASRGPVLLAGLCALVGISVYFATNPAFAMLSLSRSHAAAAEAAPQAAFLAAGEALLANAQGAGDLALLLVLLAGLLIALVMLRCGVFSRLTAIMGLLANGFGLAYFLFLLLAPGLVALPFVLSAPFRLVWYFLTARKLFGLANATAAAPTD